MFICIHNFSKDAYFTISMKLGMLLVLWSSCVLPKLLLPIKFSKNCHLGLYTNSASLSNMHHFQIKASMSIICASTYDEYFGYWI